MSLPDRILYVEAPTRVVEVDKGETKVIEVSRAINYVSDKMTFVLGTTNGTPVSEGDKQTYGTRFNDGIIVSWVVTTDVASTTSLKIQKSTPATFPVFSDILVCGVTGSAHDSEQTYIQIDDLDLFNIVVVDNTAASRITVELCIR